MARKGLGSLLGTIYEVYGSSTTTAFRPRLTTNSNYLYIEFRPYRYPTIT